MMGMFPGRELLGNYGAGTQRGSNAAGPSGRGHKEIEVVTSFFPKKFPYAKIIGNIHASAESIWRIWK
jgi:hypothetical protein